MNFIYQIVAIAVISLGVFEAADNTGICAKRTDVSGPGVKIPLEYHAKLQIHLLQSNLTMNIEYAKSSLYGLVRYNEGGGIITTIYDIKRKQVIIVAGYADGKGNHTCIVDPDSTREWDITNHENSKDEVTGADLYLRLIRKNENVWDLGDDVENGVPVRKYTECLDWEKGGMVANVTVTWTRPPWVSPNGAGINVPLTLTANGRSDKGNFNHRITFYEFATYVDPAVFDIPDGVFCPGLSTKDVSLPELPKYFSYETEIVVAHKHSLVKDKIVMYQRHFYDELMRFTRYDFVPLTTAEQDDPTAPHDHGYYTTRIYDFWTGIQYTFDNTGCFDGPIPVEDDNVQIVNKTHVMISNPLQSLGLDQLKFTYYKKGVIRGVNAEQFRAVNETTMAVHELWLTSAMDNVQNSADVMNHRQPIKYIKYPLLQPLGDDRVEINIFNFDSTEPSMFNYDVSQCYTGENKRHFMFEFRGTLQQLQVKDKRGLKYQLLWTIIQHSFVTPIRIQRIELDSRDDHTHVIFTMLEKKAFGDSADRPENELSTDDAVAAFKKALDDNAVKIGVLNATTPVVEGIPGTFNEVDRLEENQILASKKDPETTYSKSSMAGLGFGMLFLGSALGVIGGFIYLHFKPRS